MVETWKRSSRAVRETTLGICKTFQPRFGRREKASDWLVVFGKLVDRKPRGTDKYVKTCDLIISTLHLAVRHFVHVPRPHSSLFVRGRLESQTSSDHKHLKTFPSCLKICLKLSKHYMLNAIRWTLYSLHYVEIWRRQDCVTPSRSLPGRTAVVWSLGTDGGHCGSGRIVEMSKHRTGSQDKQEGNGCWLRFTMEKNERRRKYG